MIIILYLRSINGGLIKKQIMSTIRFQALREASTRKPVQFEENGRKSAIFGANVFNEKAMKQYLTSDALKGVQGAVQHGTKIDRKLADYIAMGMKEWALSKGVTHYTHWFQPLTGATAEKHDAFFETSYDGSDPVEKFGGAQLVQQEPMHLVFLMEELETHLKLEVTQHGILHHLRSFMVQLYVSLQFLFLILEKH